MFKLFILACLLAVAYGGLVGQAIWSPGISVGKVGLAGPVLSGPVIATNGWGKGGWGGAGVGGGVLLG